ncbi:5-(carboxyamino)imidazole ribonucleotide synthase [Kangiella spongicola]|uniref:N5-carboxyaminoimidazole ribonucleotide synthase n=1 Tax=Kangiella spongicola TaxID=796379 RepID=A0A318D797_9GAMM|nr:5-(carboxyamino)imidazole ribonucleotide synthase [Kangiella spongicola]PXF63805.1 5-(carboxyamino)imidazole ribonucleotide synthase [Kangiella spongicola]
MQMLVLGAGQLARMMALVAAPLDIHIRAYDVTTKQVLHPVTGERYEQSLQQAIEASDRITAEFEHVPLDVLALCEQSGKFFPSKKAIECGGDRAKEKALLDTAGVASAPYVLVTERLHLDQAINEFGLPLVIKTCQAGYDGKGQWRLKSSEQTDDIWQEMLAFLEKDVTHSIICEKMIPFEREVSVIGARDRQGNVKVYPVTENEHTNGVLTLSVAGIVNQDIQAQAIDAYHKIAEELEYVGVLAIEFFEVDGELLVNEIAPRVHNSGHWTQQGAYCCQFENHVRAVAGLPLGNTDLLRPSAMINVLGQDAIPQQVLATTGARSHWYGKKVKPGRKMGHINVSADTLNELGKRLNELSEHLSEQDYPGVKARANQLLSR